MGISANQYKIRLTGGEKFINFPLELTHTNISQEEIVEREFVEKETKQAINPIVDHDKIRYIPHIDRFDAGRIDYNINLLSDEGVFPEKTTLETIGFTNDDITYRRNNFKRSFLSLNFFDSDVPTDQNFLGNITLYNRLHRLDLADFSDRGRNVSGGSSSRDGGTRVIRDASDYQTGETRTTRGTNLTEEESTTTQLETIGVEDDGTFQEERCQDVFVLTDNSLPEEGGMYLGHVCTNYFFKQLTKYYLHGLKMRGVTQTALLDGDGFVECETSGEIGEIVTDIDFNIDVISPEYGDYRKLPSTHNHEGKTYEVFVRWVTGIYSGERELSGVYLRCISGGSSGGSGSTGGDTYSPVENNGQIKDVSQIPLRFIVEDPIKYPQGNAEGFYIYHPVVTLPESIFMRASYNNAKTGISTDLMTTNEPQAIGDVLDKIHMRYNLKLDREKYFYEIDETYSNNITTTEPDRASARPGGTSGTIAVNLYEIQVL